MSPDPEHEILETDTDFAVVEDGELEENEMSNYTDEHQQHVLLLTDDEVHVISEDVEIQESVPDGDEMMEEGETAEQALYREEIGEEEIQTLDGDGGHFEEVEDGFAEDNAKDQEVVIFKTGDGGSVITYSIPISSAGEYSADDTEREFEAIIMKDKEYQSYQIINGYLVPSSSEPHSLDPAQKQPISLSSPERTPTLTNPIKPSDLTPDSLRIKSRLKPDKLLVVYHCSFCDTAYQDFPSIKSHEALHLAEGDTPLINSNPQTSYLGSKLIPESKHCCPYCLKPFEMSAQLARHIRQCHKKERKEQKAKARRRIMCSQIKKESLDACPDVSEKYQNTRTFISVGTNDSCGNGLHKES